MTDAAGQGRLAELTIALSLATDLGTGELVEHDDVARRDRALERGAGLRAGRVVP